MKKVVLLLLAILFLAGCEKEKIKICHHDSKTGTPHTISISPNAWPAHQAHGDVLGECSPVPTVSICNQVWMVRNLDVTTYRNGDPIPQVTDNNEWANLTTGAWCYYENNSANGSIYGKLYNWYAVNDSRGLAPEGWHVPTDAEWTILSECLGGHFVAGGAMKTTGTIETGTGLWASPNTGATNSSGFTGLPGGLRGVIGIFDLTGFIGQWWSSSEDVGDFVVDYNLGWLYADLSRNTNLKINGFAVRCVKD